MFHSLELLKHLPGHEDRQENCHKFRSTLLDALRPNVQKELSTMNTAALQEYAYVFRKLGRCVGINFILIVWFACFHS